MHTITRVLVLGSNGRIGRMLRRTWTQYAAQYTGIEFVFQTRHTSSAHPDDLVWDILAQPPSAIEDAAPFDCMIVLSGITPRPDANFTLNTSIGVACVSAAVSLGIPHLLLASTSAVYGTYSDEPFVESDPLDPVNDYGRSKREMEEVCTAQARAAGLGLCCLRIGNVAGADALLINGAALAAGEYLLLDHFGNGGTPVRSYIGPQSLARVMVSLVRERMQLPAALNIAVPDAVTMYALAHAAGIQVELRPTQENAHQYVSLECSALTNIHMFEPEELEPAHMVQQWQMLKITEE